MEKTHLLCVAVCIIYTLDFLRIIQDAAAVAEAALKWCMNGLKI